MDTANAVQAAGNDQVLGREILEISLNRELGISLVLWVPFLVFELGHKVRSQLRWHLGRSLKGTRDDRTTVCLRKERAEFVALLLGESLLCGCFDGGVSACLL